MILTLKKMKSYKPLSLRTLASCILPGYPTVAWMNLLTKLGNRKKKAVALSLIPAYADQFVAESRAVPVVSDLFNTENLI